MHSHHRQTTMTVLTGRQTAYDDKSRTLQCNVLLKWCLHVGYFIWTIMRRSNFYCSFAYPRSWVLLSSAMYALCYHIVFVELQRSAGRCSIAVRHCSRAEWDDYYRRRGYNVIYQASSMVYWSKCSEDNNHDNHTGRRDRPLDAHGLRNRRHFFYNHYNVQAVPVCRQPNTVD